jgi:voltage-gated potassium channel
MRHEYFKQYLLVTDELKVEMRQAKNTWGESKGMSPIELQYIRNSERLAPAMFALSLLFLTTIAALIVVWVDIPRMEWLAAEAVEGQESSIAPVPTSFIERNAIHIGNYLCCVLFAVWPLFWAELIYNVRNHGTIKSFWKDRKFDFFACLCPPLRLAAPSFRNSGKIWLPKLGWQQPGKPLSRKLERIFGSPMLLIALLILPILLVEFGLKELVESSFGLRLTLHICTGLIWCAFAIEFIVMISATDRKFAYVKKNWVDLAIILLPLISFLRSLKAIRAFRFARLAKVQQLARFGRVYRMRGLLAKALKALLLFEFLNRVMRVTPEKQLAKLLVQRQDRADELRELDREIRKVRRRLDSDQENRESAESTAVEVQKTPSELDRRKQPTDVKVA